MWQIQQTLIDARTIHYQLLHRQQAMTFEQVLEHWRKVVGFRLFYNQLLADNPYAAFFWEHPPITSFALDAPYEFVLVDSPTLAHVSAEPRAFATHFSESQTVAVFPNLGGDAQLIVPKPLAGHSYPHLASFCRNAPEQQIHELWTKAGEATTANLSDQKRWLSTSGLGVYWLHLRLDNRPKYYHYQTYK